MRIALLYITLMVAMFTIVGCSTPQKEYYERTEKIMGTIVTLKADGIEAKVAVDESFDKIFKLVDNIKTDVKRIETEDDYVEVSQDVYEIIKISQHYSELTDGAFDVTVGAAVDLWKVARKENHLPIDEDIENTKRLVGFQHLHLRESDHSVMLDTKGVKINLGGVGKGYGADIARKVFIKHGIQDGLIDFGTSTIFAFGNKRIGLKNPRNDKAITEVVEINNSAISTSGDYEQFTIIDGRRYHHIIDPKSCMPTDNGIISVSVTVNGDIENCATLADILSTSIFVLGEQKSKELPLLKTLDKSVAVSIIGTIENDDK